VSWIDAELVLISIGAMVSPTTLTFSVLALVLGDRPLRTGWWFYVGALVATLAVGIVAAFVLGDAAASRDSSPKTWVAVVDVVAACLLLVYVAKTRNKPLEQAKVDGMVERMGKVASSPVVAVIAAGAVLANPGAFIPLALKSISETNPSAAGYVAQWLFFALVSLLPLAVALVLLFIAPDWAGRLLTRVRDLLIARARTVASVIIVLLAVALLRNGIAGLV
jgi:Sap, sulfolipid-1-addressing protein